MEKVFFPRRFLFPLSLVLLIFFPHPSSLRCTKYNFGMGLIWDRYVRMGDAVMEMSMMVLLVGVRSEPRSPSTPQKAYSFRAEGERRILKRRAME